jgi:hypothetical protein
MNAYAFVGQLWRQLGTIQEQTYIFDNVELLGKGAYKDLETGKIVKASSQPV